MLTKQKVKKSIDAMPNKMTLDQIIERLILLEKTEEGIRDADEGKVFTTDEVKNRNGSFHRIPSGQVLPDI